MGATVKLDRRGIAEFLRSAPEVRRRVHEQAEKVARNVRSAQPDADVVVDDYVTDRAASSVTVREPQAAIWQARDGLMTKAAAAAGHQIRSKR